MNNYIFNLETTKIELHFEKSEYNTLTDEQKADLKSAFLWSRTGSCWVSRAKEPNLWRAKQVAAKLGFTEEKREGERISFSKQIERQAERAESRAERYEQYAANAEQRGEDLQKSLENMHGDIAFFTQPNINSSSGRAFTNYRERLYARYHKGFEEYRKSDYFKSRAAIARGTASQAQFDNPAYLVRRIKECKKEIRDREKNIVYYEEILSAIEDGKEKKWRSGEVVTVENVKPLIAYELELVEKAMDKQGYLENCLDALGGVRFNKDNIKVGYIVLISQWGQAEIISAGPQNVRFKILTGGAVGGILTASYAEIDEIIKCEERKRTPHPFKIGERFEATRYVQEKDQYGDTHYADKKVIYEIIKVSDVTIQLKPVNADGKIITRRPKKSFNGDWCFSVDDTFENTFYKAAKITDADTSKKQITRLEG